MQTDDRLGSLECPRTRLADRNLGGVYPLTTIGFCPIVPYRLCQVCGLHTGIRAQAVS